MENFLKILKEKYHILLLFLGSIIIVLSIIDRLSTSELKTKSASLINYPILIVGVLMVLVSLIIVLSQESFFFKKHHKKISTLENNSKSISFGKSKIIVRTGKIEKTNISANLAIILPANEYFDDECINDNRSSLGAFIQSHYPNQELKIKELINNELKEKKYTLKEKSENKNSKSYGVGTSIILKRPLESKFNLIISAVTKQDSKSGIQSSISALMLASENIQKILIEERIEKIYMPLLGSGHGGLSDKVSLFSLILSFSNYAKIKQNKEINIIVFQKNKKSKADISKKDIVRTINNVCEIIC